MQDSERQAGRKEKASYHELMSAQAGESPREKIHNWKQTRKNTRNKSGNTGKQAQVNMWMETSKEWGNNMGLQYVQAKLTKGRGADGETVETGLMWDRCGGESGRGGAQEHRREAEH